MKRHLLIPLAFLLIGAAAPRPDYSLVLSRPWLVQKLQFEEMYGSMLVLPGNDYGAGYVAGRESAYRELLSTLDALIYLQQHPAPPPPVIGTPTSPEGAR